MSAINQTTSPIGEALEYLASGWSIIPIQPNDKKPAISWKQYQSEHADEATVQAWWRDDPYRNIGIVTGEISGLIVLDVDGPDGVATLETFGELPRTPTVRTGKGRHYYFRHPGVKVRNFARRLPGLDFRGDGGYVIAPPSVHENGSHYEWEVSPKEADLANAPEWLLELITEPEPSGPAIPAQASRNDDPKGLEALEVEIARLQSAEEGQRNDQLNKSAFSLGQMVGVGLLDREHVEHELWRAAMAGGLEDGEIRATIKSGLEAGIGDASKVASVEILPGAPPSIHRPLCRVHGYAYATTWVWLGDGKTKGAQRIIVRDDGQLFADASISGAMPFSNMGLEIRLSEMPPQNRLWSGAGVKHYLKGDRPDPAVVFQQVTDVVDRFIDFNRSLADQKTMSQLVACYVLATYFLDAFNVIGYLWPNGEKGSGKSKLLMTVSELAYLGQFVLAGGSFASLRDLAEQGACLGFDDCENLTNSRTGDPEKRDLLLAGNRRGTYVTLKEPAGEKNWKTRHVHVFAPRLFSAISLPDDVLGSRTIVIPLVRSGDGKKANADPCDHAIWPHDRPGLIDDLWALGLANLCRLAEYDAEVPKAARLMGRDLDTWRAILAVALWLEEYGVDSLFKRMEQLSLDYQTDRIEFEMDDSTRLAILALWNLLITEGKQAMDVETLMVTNEINRLALNADLSTQSEDFTNAKKTGRQLSRLRFKKASAGKTKRRWRISRKEVEASAATYGIPLDPENNADNAEMQVRFAGGSKV